jgi:hypothetical protein
MNDNNEIPIYTAGRLTDVLATTTVFAYTNNEIQRCL